MKRMISSCRCGSKPERQEVRNSKRRLWRVKCEACGLETHWHRPYGGDIEEWEEMVRGALR